MGDFESKGSALEFFAEDSGSCVRSPSFEVNRGLTTSIWVYLHSTGGDAAWEEQILNCNGGRFLNTEMKILH